MNFRNFLTVVLLLCFVQVEAQDSSRVKDLSFFRHYRFAGLGYTPLSTLETQTFSLELGYSLSRKVQLMAGPKFFVVDYQPFSSTTNETGSFYGGFGGIRFWWRGLPKKGWAYFSTGELHYSLVSFGNSGFFRPFVRKILSPEIGNGFGRFSERGFFLLFNFNMGFGNLLPSQVSPDPHCSLRIVSGLRF